MPAATVPKSPLALGAGALYWAPANTALPDNTVAASIFSVAWAAPYILLGITKEGHEFEYAISTDTIDAAEYLDPVQYVTTGRTASIKFEMQVVHASHMARVLNGGAKGTSGSGTTLLTTVTPPAAGAEVRCVIGWESTDSSERLVIEQALQAGNLVIKRGKGVNNATLPVEFRAEIAASGYPYQHFFAGTSRG